MFQKAQKCPTCEAAITPTDGAKTSWMCKGCGATLAKDRNSLFILIFVEVATLTGLVVAAEHNVKIGPWNLSDYLVPILVASTTVFSLALFVVIFSAPIKKLQEADKSTTVESQLEKAAATEKLGKAEGITLAVLVLVLMKFSSSLPALIDWLKKAVGL